MRVIIFILSAFLFACNVPAQKKNATDFDKNKLLEASYKRIPKHCKAWNMYKMLIPYQGDTSELILTEFQDTIVGEPVGGFGNSWVIIGQKNFFGLSAEIADTEIDGASGKKFIGQNTTVLFNDSIKQITDDGTIINKKDTFNIFPTRIDTLLASPDGKYIAASVGVAEANDVIDIIDASELITAGHYKVIKEIDAGTTSDLSLIKWDNNKLIITAEGYIDSTSHTDLIMTDLYSDSVKAFSYDVKKKVFAEYPVK